jgi:cytochrome b561
MAFSGPTPSIRPSDCVTSSDAKSTETASGEFGIRAGNVTTVNRALVQLFLYGLMLSQPGSGLGQTTFRGREVVLFVTRIPNLVPADPALRASFYFAHQFGICLLAILVACQAVVALVLHFILSNGELRCRTPGVNGTSGTPPPVPVRANR